MRPNDYITRTELAAMFDRILEKDSISKIQSAVSKKDSNLSSLDIFTDHTSTNSEYITRAEMIMLVTKMKHPEVVHYKVGALSDVSQKHWASKYINYAAHKGYIVGYENGTLKPDQNLTRAEAISILNRVMQRDADRMYINQNYSKVKVYQDVKTNHWAFYEIVEATMPHYYKYNDKQKEKWEDIIELN